MFGNKSESWLIVGLGNPGKEYEKTRHNCGFRAIDVLADKLGCKVDKGKFQGLYGQVNYQGKKLYLLDRKDDLSRLGLWALRLQFTTESPQEVDRVLNQYDTAAPFDNATCTRGLYLRGVE